MFSSIFTWFQSNSFALAIPAFTAVSIAVNAAASIFKAFGKDQPSWLGKVATFVGNVLHIFNGNVQLK